MSFKISRINLTVRNIQIVLDNIVSTNIGQINNASQINVNHNVLLDEIDDIFPISDEYRLQHFECKLNNAEFKSCLVN